MALVFFALDARMLFLPIVFGPDMRALRWLWCIAHQVEFSNGIPKMRSIKRSHEARNTFSFRVDHEDDPADRPISRTGSIDGEG